MCKTQRIKSDFGQKIDLHIIIFIFSPEIRAHWVRLLGNPTFKDVTVKSKGLAKLNICDITSEYEIIDYIKSVFKSGSHSAVILVSDQLLNNNSWKNSCDKSSSLLKHLQVCFSDKLFAILALLQTERRVPEVDLAMRYKPEPEALTEALSVLISRLDYLSPPPVRESSNEIAVHPIKNRDELCQSFKLRYKVYRIMGYLDQEFLDTGSKIELTWSDTISMHFGAFVSTSIGSEKLIGTARLILTHGADPLFDKWTWEIAKSDIALVGYLEKQQELLAQWKLPIFLTLPLNEEICQAFSGEPNAPAWAEVSRVVVEPEYRGYGVGRQLIKAVIDEADSIGVENVFLECLEVHRSMYESFGFASIGLQGTVIGIGKEMIGMRRTRKKVKCAETI